MTSDVHALSPLRSLLLITALTLGAAACGTPDESMPVSPVPPVASGSAPTIAPSPSAAETGGGGGSGEIISVFDVEVGDCFNAPDAAELSEVELIDCADPHTYEAYHSEDHPAASDEAFIGDEAMTEYAEDVCLGQFEDFVGAPWEEAEPLTYFYILPTAETWDIGDREILCAVFSEDGDLTGSAQGSGQ